ncbi:MAG: BACON domain-containing protein, partial [Bacteroidales bacterium]|nr:BACON domain-containing protein [Bacteroidales bacterium]
MKKILQFVLVITAAAALASCQATQPDGSQYAADPTLSLDVSTVQFNAEGGSARVFVKEGKDLLVAAEKPWLSAVAEGRFVTVTAEPNAKLDARYSMVTILSGKIAATLQVVQFGTNSDFVWDSSYDFPYGGGNVILQFKPDGSTIKINVNADWAHATPDLKENTLTIDVDANDTVESRIAVVSWQMGEDVRSISINQAGNPNAGGDDDDDDDD